MIEYFWVEALRKGDDGNLVWRQDVMQPDKNIKVSQTALLLGLRVLYGDSVDEVPKEERSLRICRGLFNPKENQLENVMEYQDE